MVEASQREGIARVRGLFKLTSSDTYVDISDRAILSELQSTTILFIKQVTDKRKLWNSPNIFTQLPCIQMKQVPLAECCGYSAPCTIARSVTKLPKIAEGTNFGMLIQGLYSIDTVSRRFIESTPDRFVNSLNLGLKTNQIHFWIQNKYLYIADEYIKQVRISAYFEEDIPQDMISYPKYCGNTLSVGCCPSGAGDEVSINDMSRCCPPNPYDSIWTCPGYMQDAVIKEVANKLLSTFKRSDDGKDLLGKDTTK